MHLAKRACVSYLKSVYLMKDKEVFKFPSIDREKMAEAFGLAKAPELDFDPNQNVTLTNTMSRSEQRTARI